MDLFSNESQYLKLPNAEIIYSPDFFTQKEANSLFEVIKQDTNWIQDTIKVFGKTYQQPRLTALFGETNTPYSYSNITMQPVAFTKILQKIKVKVEQNTNTKFNTVLLNLYRNGNDSNGWHADNEKELGKNPIIASVSFGEERFFHFKHRTLKEHKYKLRLQNGSLLLMKGEMQHFWLHQIAKTKKPINERLNLTFRKLIPFPH